MTGPDPRSGQEETARRRVARRRKLIQTSDIPEREHLRHLGKLVLEAFFAWRGLLIMTPNESLQPHEQDEALEHFLVRSALALRHPVHSFEALQSWLSGLSRGMLLDILERSTLMLVFGHFAFVMLTAPAGTAGTLGLILLVSESLPVFLILTRRQSKALSEKTGDWLLGLTGAILPLLAVPVGSKGLVSPELVVRSC